MWVELLSLRLEIVHMAGACRPCECVLAVGLHDLLIRSLHHHGPQPSAANQDYLFSAACLCGQGLSKPQSDVTQMHQVQTHACSLGWAALAYWNSRHCNLLWSLRDRCCQVH